MASRGSKMGQHTRTRSQLVPAVPRVFEKKTRKGFGDQGPARVDEKVQATPVQVQEQPQNERARNSLENTTKARYNDGSDPNSSDEHVLTPKQDHAGTWEQATSYEVSQPLPDHRTNAADLNSSRPRVSLPPRHAPPNLLLPTQASFSTKNKPRAAESSPARPTHSRSLHKIAFGSFGNFSESSDSSPVLPPSATSTHFTQPTPVSETRSQTSVSEHEGTVAKSATTQAAKTVSNPSQSSVMVGPYRAGLLSAGFSEFFEFRQQFLANHLKKLYERNEGDVTVRIHVNKGMCLYNLHSTILSQSSMIAAAIQMAADRNDLTAEGRLCITFGIQDRFTSIPAIEKIFRSLYGYSIIDEGTLDQPYLDPHVFYALFSASCLLGLPGHQFFSVNCIVDLLNWQTLPDVFDLCLTGRTFPACQDPFPKRSDEIASPLFQPQASFLIDRAISNLAQGLNQSEFLFDTNAPNFSGIGGLPPRGASIQTPVLNTTASPTIVFGDLNATSSVKNSVLSSLLLSLPLIVLQRVATEITVAVGGDSPNVIELAVQERESRRVAYAESSGNSGTYVKEKHVSIEFLPNGIGVINDPS